VGRDVAKLAEGYEIGTTEASAAALDGDNVVSFPQAVVAIIASGGKIGAEHLGLVAFEFVVIPVRHRVVEQYAIEAARHTDSAVAGQQRGIDGE
jgi:hypothetical protein